MDCHDPHSPRFGKIEPLPGPNTLRMGEPYHHSSEAQDRNPLERWKAALGKGHGDAAHSDSAHSDAAHNGDDSESSSTEEKH